MNYLSTNRKPFGFLELLLFLQIILYITIFFDITVAKQLIGFVYFTFVPGFVIVKLLKLERLGLMVNLLLSVGFSVAFLMFLGLIINQFFELLNIPQPLSLTPLLLILTSLTFICGIVAYLRSGSDAISKFEGLSIHPQSIFLFLALPILSIIGAIMVNSYANNLVLLFTIFSIALLFSIGLLSRRFLPPKFYPLALLMIGVAILFHSSLVSNYIVTFGSDVNVESIIFNLAKTNAAWSSVNQFSSSALFGRYNSMLSITILPATYSALLSLDSTWIFKILTPFLFSFVPLGLYFAWKEQISAKYAFISAFLFMAQLTFFTEMLGLNRQMIAELFFALLLFVTFSKQMNYHERLICFIIFGASLIVSHYAMAEIFLLFIVAALVSLIIFKRPNRKLSMNLVVLFFVMMLAWYIFVSYGDVFNSILEYSTYVRDQLSSFFSLSSRGEAVLLGLGLQPSPSIWNTISRFFAYLTEFFIVVGFITLARQKIRNRHFWDTFFVFATVAMGFLVALVAVPGLANTLKMTRFYHILLFFVAPLFVIGIESLVKLSSKRKRQLLVCAVSLAIVIPYFLFQTNFVYEITKTDSWSVSLSQKRMNAFRLYYTQGYTDSYSVFGAKWLSGNINFGISVYSDASSIQNVLYSYGLIYATNLLSNVTTIEHDSVIYLNTLNVEHGIILDYTFLWNSTDFSAKFSDLNLIYNNGNCTIYQNP